MFQKDESGDYALVDPEECALDSPRIPLQAPYSRRLVIKTVLCTQLLNVALLSLVYLVFWYQPFSASEALGFPPTDFNMSTTFEVDKTNLHLVANNSEADAYWMSITKGYNNGLVSVSKAWAEEQGLDASGVATVEGETVFQVDAFHQLHCLVRLLHAP
jgi:hypothetical protein